MSPALNADEQRQLFEVKLVEIEDRRRKPDQTLDFL
jgi:hypothetical protein